MFFYLISAGIDLDVRISKSNDMACMAYKGLVILKKMYSDNREIEDTKINCTPIVTFLGFKMNENVT